MTLWCQGQKASIARACTEATIGLILVFRSFFTGMSAFIQVFKGGQY